jgi:hypothetical protein
MDLPSFPRSPRAPRDVANLVGHAAVGEHHADDQLRKIRYELARIESSGRRAHEYDRSVLARRLQKRMQLLRDVLGVVGFESVVAPAEASAVISADAGESCHFGLYPLPGDEIIAEARFYDHRRRTTSGAIKVHRRAVDAVDIPGRRIAALQDGRDQEVVGARECHDRGQHHEDNDQEFQDSIRVSLLLRAYHRYF